MRPEAILSLVGSLGLVIAGVILGITADGGGAVLIVDTPTPVISAGGADEDESPGDSAAVDNDEAGGEGAVTKAEPGPTGDCSTMRQVPIEPTGDRGGGHILHPTDEEASVPIVVVVHQGGAPSVDDALAASGWCEVTKPIVLVVPEGKMFADQDPPGLWWRADDGALAPERADGQAEYIVSAIRQAEILGGDLDRVIISGVGNGAAMAMNVGCAETLDFDLAFAALIDPLISRDGLLSEDRCSSPAFSQTVVVSSEAGASEADVDTSDYLVGARALDWMLRQTMLCEPALDGLSGTGCDRPLAIELRPVAGGGFWHADRVPAMAIALVAGDPTGQFPTVSAELDASAG